MVKCYEVLDYYHILHNVSGEQSVVTVNRHRNNATLYGVQPGETYTVKIIPYRAQSLLLVSNVLQIQGNNYTET